jgi:hypothetical protein
MAGVPGDPLSGLPDPVRQLLGQPPVTEKKLLELRAEWPAVSPGRARMADALRLFVITWDPLELLALRPAAFAAVNTRRLARAEASNPRGMRGASPWSRVTSARREAGHSASASVSPAQALGSAATGQAGAGARSRPGRDPAVGAARGADPDQRPAAR